MARRAPTENAHETRIQERLVPLLRRLAASQLDDLELILGRFADRPRPPTGRPAPGAAAADSR